MGFGVGSQVERGFSWERKGPLKAWAMALRLNAHTADAAMLLLYGEIEKKGESAQQGRRGMIEINKNKDRNRNKRGRRK